MNEVSELQKYIGQYGKMRGCSTHIKRAVGAGSFTMNTPPILFCTAPPKVISTNKD
jgi:hypothetical protein